MKINLEIQKKHFYIFLSVMVVIGIIFLVKAAVPNPGHSVTQIDFSPDFSIGGKVTFNNIARGWSLMGSSLSGLCFSEAKGLAGFPGYAGVAGNFYQNGTSIWTSGQHTGTEVCTTAGYNRCVGAYQINLYDKSFDIVYSGASSCTIGYPYNRLIGPGWDWSTTYPIGVCCTQIAV